MIIWIKYSYTEKKIEQKHLFDLSYWILQNKRKKYILIIYFSQKHFSLNNQFVKIKDQNENVLNFDGMREPLTSC